MKKNILLLLLAFTSLVTLAQAPANYYDNATGKTGEELRSALHDIVKDHTVIAYQQIWNAFWSTDNKGNGVVWDMYSDIPNGTPPYSYSLGQNQCGSYDVEGDCYNREHSWPKSWFSGNEQTTPGRDLHHIFPTDGFVNYQRSSFPFGEVNNASWTSQNGSKLGTCKSSLGYTGTVFEPIDEYKGDFARAIMYMSVRYLNEDSDWGSSGMTDKSVIKPWAINMLLSWSDQDPVSQKEIDRNNIIFRDYQHNRNPFIDHPEYARAIWDPTWTGVEYNINYSTVQHGSITGPSKATQGSTVTLTATSSEGYMMGSWTVYKTDDPSTTVSVNSDGSFTMPAFNVTVGASFVENNTYYNITCANVQHGSIGTSANSAKSGKSITLTASPATGYSLYSWYVYKTDDMNTMVYHGTGNTFTMPAFNVTVTATFVQGVVGDYYAKVTTAPTDWSGQYLIVYETGSKAFNGNLDTLDVVSNTISVTINSNMIASTTTTESSEFNINKSGDNYTIKSASGKYIGQTSNNNGLATSPTQAYANTISFNTDENSINIISSGGAYLRYNANTGQERFRYFKSGTYTGQKSIQLYKKTSGTAQTPTHTIQFNSNGGSGSMSNQTVDEFEPTQLNTNIFQRSGYEFMGWNTQADGMGQYYTDGATVILLNDLTLYAQWKQLFSITLATVQNGTITASHTQAVEGDLIGLTATPATGYEFDYWNITDAENHPVNVVDNEFEMPASNVTVVAAFAYVGTFASQYCRVTDVNQLVAGRKYLIVNTTAGKAMGASSSNGNNRTAVTVEITDNTISNRGEAYELTLGGSSDEWTFYDSCYNNNAGGYLYAAGTGNHLKTKQTLDDKGKWTISISNGIATITSKADVTQNTIKYNPNSGNPLFSCYSSTNNYALAELYILNKEFDHTEDETIANLLPFDKHTIRSGVTLTVTGTATCDDANHLVLEEGAQLVHHTANVTATVKKAITAYYDDNGWYTIATPFTTYTPTEITSDNYDLYAYNEAGPLEWLNHKTEGFSLASGAGYLYAHHPSTNLHMTGILNSGDHTETVDLSYNNSTADLKGFNLLGNPTAHDITFTKSSGVSDGYYYLDNDDSWVYTTTSSVPVGRGFLVKANAAGQTVTLNPQNRGLNNDNGQFIAINIDGEKAYVKMTEGVSMPLLSFRDKSSSLWLKHDQKPYIMLVRDDADAIELNFRTPLRGTHRLSVNTEGSNLNYLHLIDRITGADIDLLSTPNYSFESNSSDYTSRFQLVFNPEANENENEDFAFISNGQIIINGKGNLQVIDLLGHQLFSREVNSSLLTPNSSLSPGVYMLRLITPDKVRTQKIIVN